MDKIDAEESQPRSIILKRATRDCPFLLFFKLLIGAGSNVDGQLFFYELINDQV